MKKCIVLCADDYGQAPAISQGIINLIQNGRLSATSCLVTSTYWSQHAKWLIPLRSKIDIGLHFNLTEGSPLSEEYIQQGRQFPSLSRLLVSALTFRLSRFAIEAECHAQIDKFEQELGFLPDYLDGHQHVHQFPIIRDAMISVYNSRLSKHKTYIRLANETIKPLYTREALKKWVVHAMGVNAFKALLESNQIIYNQSFAGIYSFKQAQLYPVLFKRFLQATTDKGMIMCHPGLSDLANLSDPIAAARFKEYQYFSSPEFIQDCTAQDVTLSRFFAENPSC